MIAAAQYSSAAENRAAADTIRKRLMNPANLVRQLPAPPKAKVIPFYAKQIPLWEQQDINFDAHVKAWNMELFRRTSPEQQITIRCEEFGIPLAVMRGPSQTRDVAVRRQFLMWDIHQQFGCSFVQIGRLFGGRDHSTVSHAIKKISSMTDEQRAFFTQAQNKGDGTGLNEDEVLFLKTLSLRPGPTPNSGLPDMTRGQDLARTRVKRKGWAHFDRSVWAWRITEEGRGVLRTHILKAKQMGVGE